MLIKIIVSIFSIFFLLNCSSEKIVDAYLDLFPDGSKNYTLTDLKNGGFEIDFKIEIGVNHYIYKITSAQTFESSSLLNTFYITDLADKLTCIPRNEESFNCTSNKDSFILKPSPELYLHLATYEIEAEDALNENSELSDLASYANKLETITVDGIKGLNF